MRTWPALEISPLDDLVQAALLDHDVLAIDDDRSRVFFGSAEARDRAIRELAQQFSGHRLAAVDVPDEDWAARSQATLTAVRVGGIVVAPPWDEAAGEAGDPLCTIVIQPSMGFGTGHHATTRLCLAHLQDLPLAGRSLLDVGTGSGVLAIAASRLGAAPVLAIDDDPDALASARENLELNAGVNVTLGELDVRRATLRPFGVVTANLTGGLLQAAASALQQLTAPGGFLVLSGFLDAEAAGVVAAFAACRVERESREDGWVCVTLGR